MDNHFVPNLTLGLPVVESLLKHAALPIDCHLMIEDPDRHAPAYAEAGAGSVTIHAEAAKAPVRTLRAIRGAGAAPGLASTRAPPIEPYEDLLDEVDMVLLMTVEPGFGGQKFLDLVLPKIRRARAMIAAARRVGEIWLQVDGGVSRGDDRAVRRGGRGRVRRRVGRLRRAGPGAGRARPARAGGAGDGAGRLAALAVQRPAPDAQPSPSSTVTCWPPGLTVSWVSSETSPDTVIATVALPPALSVPDAGVTVSLPSRLAGSEIDQRDRPAAGGERERSAEHRAEQHRRR